LPDLAFEVVRLRRHGRDERAKGSGAIASTFTWISMLDLVKQIPDIGAKIIIN
jgi:hypothetical protein